MKNNIKSALMLFGKEKQLSKDLFIRQSGCSEDDIHLRTPDLKMVQQQLP